jgi:hypothetical protein
VARAVLSSRLDYLDPAEPGWPNTVNSLREAFVGWQDAAAEAGVDAGRFNCRLGPAYGFNPTDCFRDGSLRVVTSAEPLSWRDNRMGTMMLRGGWAASGVLAPKLDDERSTNSFSADLGATNHTDRALLVVSSPTLGTTSGQGTQFFYKRGKGWQLAARSACCRRETCRRASVGGGAGRSEARMTGHGLTNLVHHIQQAAAGAGRFVAGVDEDTFLASKRRQRAVMLGRPGLDGFGARVATGWRPSASENFTVLSSDSGPWAVTHS